jgi:putative ABC transport system permease protein
MGLLNRVTGLFKQARLERDLDEELQHHVELKTQENIEGGMSPDEARNAALRAFGGVKQKKEQCRDADRLRWIEDLIRDLRYGVRQLRRNPGFTAVAVLTLALGIGATTAIFSVVNGVLLRPLPYPNADRLVWLSNYDKRFKQDDYGSRADYVIWKKEANSFEGMTAYGTESLAVMLDGKSFEARFASITGDFWSITGARVYRGRLFGHEEPHTMVLSYGFFVRRFGSNQDIIGKTLIVNGYPLTVTGVLRKNFRFLFPQQSSLPGVPPKIDAYIPIPNAVEVPGQIITQKHGPAPFWVSVVGKLRPHVPISKARAQMETIYDRIAREYPTSPPRSNTVLHVVPLREKLTAGVEAALLVLFGAVGFVLLIACGNISNLLLARASTRHREVAIRASLGAGRRRVIRQFLTESVLLALLGGGAGLVLAKWSLGLMLRLASEAIPRLGHVQINGHVLLFTLGVSILTGVLFGLAPALSFWRGSLYDGLKGDAQTSVMGSKHSEARGWMASAELALTLTFLAGAGLMLRSFWRMNTYPPGFNPGRILTMIVPFSGPKYKAWLQEQEYVQRLIHRIGALPGVQAVGADRGTLHVRFRAEGSSARSRQSKPMAAFRAVSPGFLRAVGAPLLKGRWAQGGEEGLNELVVNESFARAVFGKSDPIGNQIDAGFLKGQIVGVVADFKYWRLDAAPERAVYFPYQLLPEGRSITVLVRTSGNPAPTESAVQKLAAQIDPTQPLYHVMTLQESFAESIAPRRFDLFLLVAFASVALLMACVGIYGVIAYSVARRTHEIGVRMALGARKADVLTMVVGQGIRLALIGVGIGVAAALVLTRFLSSLLYGVKPTDPVTFVAVSLILSAAALLACYIPARRATKVDPMVALRYE